MPESWGSTADIAATEKKEHKKNLYSKLTKIKFTKIKPEITQIYNQKE